METKRLHDKAERKHESLQARKGFQTSDAYGQIATNSKAWGVIFHQICTTGCRNQEGRELCLAPRKKTQAVAICQSAAVESRALRHVDRAGILCSSRASNEKKKAHLWQETAAKYHNVDEGIEAAIHNREAGKEGPM